MTTTQGTTYDLEWRARLELQVRYRSYLRAASDAWAYQDHPVYRMADRAEARAHRNAAAGLVWVLTGR